MKDIKFLTWEANVCKHNLLAVFDSTDLWEVDIQGQECSAAEESQWAHSHTVVTRILIAVKDAEFRHLIWPVHIAFISDGAKDHNREDLKVVGKEKDREKQGLRLH